jgi:hypothetical protein
MHRSLGPRTDFSMVVVDGITHATVTIRQPVLIILYLTHYLALKYT